MKQAVATIISKGQITIPVAIRRHLGLSEGDKVEFTVDEQGCVRLERGSIRPSRRCVAWLDR